MQKIICLFLVLGLCAFAHANIVVDTVLVGNTGNTGEWSGASYGGTGPDRVCGQVDYYYYMGKFEVTCAQYTAFLNAVAATDTYSLYNTTMATGASTYSIGIDRSGSPGSYTYSVVADRADRPVAYVNWGAAVRFVNWLEKGQPTGPQDTTTTEDGSYFINGATSNANLNAVVRKTTAHYVIPTEDEWYKAAYHKNDGDTGNYFDYTTSSDIIPSYTWADPDPGNKATWSPNKSDYTIGPPYYRTTVGQWSASGSPYGTFDMGGNVLEWTEQYVISGTTTRRQLRGGSYDSPATSMFSGYRSGLSPSGTTSAIGFRIAYLPEPATLVLLSCGALAMLRRRR